MHLWLSNLNFTVWKLQDFSITQILRETNFWDSRNAKTAVFAILRAVMFVHMKNFSLQKLQKSYKSKFSAPKCVKIADFALLESLKLISRDRKIMKFP